MMKMELNRPPLTWGIVGLGWLGTKLQSQLQAAGQNAWGTHRDSFDFRHQSLPATPCDVLFLNTPPLTDIAPHLFCSKVSSTQAQRVIFISSTSVFGMACGKVDETSAPAPDTTNGEWLVAVESLLREQFREKLTIIRPAGLMGGERHPVKHLSGRKDVSGGNEKVNLIHRHDLVNIILRVPQNVPLVHAVAAYHPPKEVYYAQWAQRLGLAIPQFKASPYENREIGSRVVSSFYTEWECPQLDFI